MEFWDQHDIIFFIGIFLWPRMMLIYYGIIPIHSISAILEFLFVPRIFLVSTLSPIYYDNNPTLISICWVLAVILDIVGIIFKISMQKTLWEQSIEMRDEMMRKMSKNYY